MYVQNLSLSTTAHIYHYISHKWINDVLIFCTHEHTLCRRNQYDFYIYFLSCDGYALYTVIYIITFYQYSLIECHYKWEFRVINQLVTSISLSPGGGWSMYTAIQHDIDRSLGTLVACHYKSSRVTPTRFDFTTHTTYQLHIIIIIFHHYTDMTHVHPYVRYAYI